VPTLETLLASPHQVVGLVTQPDRTGRGHHRHLNPMKETALAAGIPVFQPDDVNRPDALDRLRDFAADLYVVAAYGQILSADLLEIPPRGAVNLHASLLPKYRGAAPIQYAILNGETTTGVSIFQIEPRLDAGPVLGVVETPIGPRETSGELEERLSALAAPLTLSVLSQIEAGTTRGVDQDPGQVTRAPRMRKQKGLIEWSRTAREIDCHIRAMQPWPMPFTFLFHEGRQPVRVLIHEIAPEPLPPASESTPGRLSTPDGSRLFVATGDGRVEVLRLQPAGKRVMTAVEFLRGRSISETDRFGADAG
jgi:methionyl-tRNA formyltransferase